MVIPKSAFLFIDIRGRQLTRAGDGLGRTGGLSGVLLDGLTLLDESVLAGAGGRGAGEAALDGLADRGGAEVGGEAREEHLALGEHGVRIRCGRLQVVLEECNEVDAESAAKVVATGPTFSLLRLAASRDSGCEVRSETDQLIARLDLGWVAGTVGCGCPLGVAGVQRQSGSSHTASCKLPFASCASGRNDESCLKQSAAASQVTSCAVKGWVAAFNCGAAQLERTHGPVVRLRASRISSTSFVVCRVAKRLRIVANSMRFEISFQSTA